MDVSLERVQLCVTRLGRCARSRGAGSCGGGLTALGTSTVAACTRHPPRATLAPIVYPDGPAVDTGWDRVVGIDMRSPIKRVLYLMQENRSFDHVFGALPGANGATTGSLLGEEVPLVRCPQWLPGDLPQTTMRRLRPSTAGGWTTSPSPTSSGPTLPRSQRPTHTRSSTRATSRTIGTGLENTHSATTSSPRSPVPPTRTTSSSWPGIPAVCSTTRENTRTVPFPGGGRWKSWGCDAPEDVFVLSREDGTTSPQARQARRDRRSIRAPRNGPRWPEQFRTVRERSFRFPIGTQS
jgi:hypothetical protein